MNEVLLIVYHILPAFIWQVLFIATFIIVMRNFAMARRASLLFGMIFLFAACMCAVGRDERAQEWITLEQPVDMRLGPNERYPIIGEKISGRVQVICKESGYGLVRPFDCAQDKLRFSEDGWIRL